MIQFLVMVCDGDSYMFTKLSPGCAKPRSSHDKQVNSFQSKWTITLHFSGHVSLPFFHFLPSLVFTFQIYKELQSWMELNFHYANTWTGTLKDKINLQARQWKWHFSVDTASRMWLTVWLFQCLQFQFVIYLLLWCLVVRKPHPFEAFLTDWLFVVVFS